LAKEREGVILFLTFKRELMKFLLLGILTVGIFALLFGGFLFLQVKLANGTPTTVGGTTAVTKKPSTANPTSSGVPATTNTSTFSPPDFHGPTGEPHVNGPSSPPPNY
jgi:hypothetical protein